MQRYISNNRVPRKLRCDQAQTFRAKRFQFSGNSNHIKVFFAPVDDHRSIGVVERLIQTLKRRLEVMRIFANNTSFKLASDVAEIIKPLRIAPRGITRVTPFEEHMCRKANTPNSNKATISSSNNLNKENAKHACLDRKNLMHPPIPAKTMHKLQNWSEDEVKIKKRNPRACNQSTHSSYRQYTGVKTRRALAVEEE